MVTKRPNYLLFCLTFCFSGAVSSKVVSGTHGIRNWLMSTELNTSFGIRLSVSNLPFQFAGESLLLGYGEEKI
jgi:hypothetical protein